MLKRLALAASAVMIAATFPVAGAAAVPEVQPLCDTEGCDPPGVGSGGGEITVWLSGSGVSGGGEVIQIDGEEIGVAPVCWYVPKWTGKTYWDEVQDTAGLPVGKFPDAAKYKDDDKGYWWWTTCDESRYKGDDFGGHQVQFAEENDPVYVEEGEDPPVTPVDPEELAWLAFEHLDLPDPDIGWNPRLDGNGATLVNLDTWIWLEDSAVDLDLTAEANGAWATVHTWVTSMNLSAPYADPVQCADFGTAWDLTEPSGSCVLNFGRSSAGLPGNVTPVTVETLWSADWVGSGGTSGVLDNQAMAGQATVPVGEVQTIVGS